MSRVAGALLSLAAALGAAAPAAAQDVAIKPGTLLVSADKKPLHGQTILIRKGKVVAVGADVKVPEGVPVLARPDAWVVPGFVDLETGLSLDGDRNETTDPLAGDVRVASRIDPDHRDFRAALRAGVTTALVTPGSENLFGGQAALRKTTGAELHRSPPVAKLALGAGVYRRGRRPTSRGGALALLRRTLAEQHAKQGGGILNRFARGEAPTIASVDGVAELSALLPLQARYGLQLIFAPDRLFPHDLRAVDLAGKWVALAGSRPGLVTALARAKAKLILVSDQPKRPPVALRKHAVDAAREGLDAKLAFAAITSAPAAALGLGDRIGSLAKGCDGDLVVLDGPPLQLSARVLEVFVDGTRVYRRPGKKKRD